MTPILKSGLKIMLVYETESVEILGTQTKQL